MGLWLYHYDKVNKIVNSAPSNIVDPKPVAKAILAEIQGKPPFTTDEAVDILYEMEQATTLGEFNDALNNLYDYGDVERVWFGIGW